MRGVLFWASMIVLAALVWQVTETFGPAETTITTTEFMDRLGKDQFGKIEVISSPSGAELRGFPLTEDPSGKVVRSFVPPDFPNFYADIKAKNVELTAKKESANGWAQFLFLWAPILLMVGFWVFMTRQMQSGGNKAMSFGKSRAKLSSSTQKKVTFKEVAGADEAKEELQEIIEFLREPQKFQKLGGRIPKGVLLMGSPGTGKTLMARAVAGEANVPFFSISGSDFVEMFVGVGASRVRDLFEQGKKNAPCIVFIDEIDAVGRHRGAGLGGGHDEREQTLNQLLVEMDGFESNEGVILIAATNRPDVLDPALLRPGRFDRRIVVSRPDVKGREGILLVHTKKIPLSDDVDINVIARGTAGFCGADLANLVNEAALNAARYNQKVVRMNDFEHAKDKVMMGAERRSMIITEEEKRITAIHEAGHALLAVVLPYADPIHKVTIIPRGMALGLTMQLPVEEKHNYSRDFLNDQMAILMGGRIAEEITNGGLTTGAGNDIERATDLARRMVCEWGMSDEMGPLTFGKVQAEVFLGREISRPQEYSQETASRIDSEVKRFVLTNYDRARTLLLEHKAALLKIADELLAREVLDADQVQRLAKGLDIGEAPSAPAPTSGGDQKRPEAPDRTPIVPPIPKPITQA
ncbi:MAG TPA: ATP-dependent zinc metalloprotease FtsH [Vicinamibacterales bacterium]|nr:ATP-dependent zinc metalloprotease FtsH [Vicinamibacterales bacterium]